MTNEEFNTWLADYQVRFRGVAALLAESQSLVDDWYRMLKGFDLETIQGATRDVTAMDPQPYPGDHLGKLIRFSKDRSFAAPKQIDYSRVESYKCLQCQDRGVVWVYHPMAYGPIRKGEFDAAKHVNEIVVACYCDQGKQHQRPKTQTSCHPLMLFDANRMLPVSTADDLVDFVANRYRPRNYHDEFSEFAR